MNYFSEEVDNTSTSKVMSPRWNFMATFVPGTPLMRLRTLLHYEDETHFFFFFGGGDEKAYSSGRPFIKFAPTVNIMSLDWMTPV